MESSGVLERPCIYLEKTSYVQPAESLPAVRGQRAKVECLAARPEECPKKKNRMDITMLCFRIRGHNFNRKKAAIEKERKP